MLYVLNLQLNFKINIFIDYGDELVKKIEYYYLGKYFSLVNLFIFNFELI